MVDFPSELKALAESTNPLVLRGSPDLSERVANQISHRLNGDTVITADMIQSCERLPFKRKWSNKMSECGFQRDDLYIMEKIL